MYHGTAHVILGSGLTIAGATFCLSFTRLPYFQTLGVPLAIGMMVGVAGRADARARDHHRRQPVRRCSSPSARMRIRGWRKIGAAVVRWPGPILVATIALVADRPADAARLPDQLQRPQLPARRPSAPTRATRPPTGTSRRRG